MNRRRQPVFRILRYFSITSLTCTLLAAWMLTWLYRHSALDGIVDYGERSNLLLTHSLLSAIEPQLSLFLSDEALHHGGQMPQPLKESILRMMENTNVVSVDILDDEGVVVFSTDETITGSGMMENPGVQSAQSGVVHSKMGLHGQLHQYHYANPDATLISSYIPIRPRQSSLVEGVFAIETNVTQFVDEIEHVGRQVFFGSVAIMASLYLALLAIVHHAARVIQRQDTQLQERSRALELLSSQLITVQENEKKRIAHELHEGVAQTLSSIKLRLERANTLLKESSALGELSLEKVVQLVQEVIRETLALALDLRPPSLDEIGVLATINWYARELSSVFPLIDLQVISDIDEKTIPAPLKVVLYRTVQQRLQYLTQKNLPMAITIKLAAEGELLCLTLSDNRLPDAVTDAGREEERLHLLTLREFLALSGGTVSIQEHAPSGVNTIRTEWAI